MPKFTPHIVINFLPLKLSKNFVYSMIKKQIYLKASYLKKYNNLVTIYTQGLPSVQKLSIIMVSRTLTNKRQRKEQVHPKLYNTHSSNQRIPEGGVCKAVMGRG